jgi:hypothetical protein
MSRTLAKLATLVAVLVAGAAGASVTHGAPAHAAGCSAPRTYDVVQVDPRFHVSRAAVIALLVQAERLWEVPMKRNLLQYEPGGQVHVSLVYDSRTTAYLAHRRASTSIGGKDAVIARGRASLEQMQRDLDRKAHDLESRKAALNKRIQYWNGRGGAPKSMYQLLRSQQDSIVKATDAYNRELASERRAEASFNSLVAARNALVAGADKGTLELGRAQRGGTEMELFALTGNRAKDTTLAAHEFGHILGLAHIPGVRNIMNPYLVGALKQASPADVAALETVCRSDS